MENKNQTTEQNQNHENGQGPQQQMSQSQITKLLLDGIKNMQTEVKYWELNSRIEKAKYESMVYRIKYFELMQQSQPPQVNDDEVKQEPQSSQES